MIALQGDFNAGSARVRFSCGLTDLIVGVSDVKKMLLRFAR